MTRDEAREFAKVVQAYADGKQIQRESSSRRGEWIDQDDDASLYAWVRHRIKPEPREWWVVVKGDAYSLCVFDKREDAEVNSRAFSAHACVSVVHVREVME